MNSCSIGIRNTLAMSLLMASVVCLYPSNLAFAASKKPDAETLEQENAARRACLDGDHAKGVAILTRLFVDTKHAVYIFNQGRCLEQNRQYQDAIARFQEYLRAGRKNLADSDRAEAEQHISDCKEMLAQERAATAPPPAPAPLPQPTPIARPEPAPEPEKPIAESPREEIPASNGSGLRIAGIVTASVGVVAVGAGVLSSILGNRIVDDMYKKDDGYKNESSRKTYATLTWVGYGVGAACIVTGAILYGVGLKAKSSSDSNLALVPSLGDNFAGANLTGAF